MVSKLFPMLIFANFLSKCQKFKQNVLPVLDTVSSTSMELDAVTPTRKKDKIKSAYFSLFQIDCILE